MFLAAARDVDSIFLLDSRLSRAREAYIATVLRGEEPEPNFITKRERLVVEDLKWVYFNAEMRRKVEMDEDLTDDEDYESHSQKLLEKAIWWTHERVKEIPFVGQDGYGDD